MHSWIKLNAFTHWNEKNSSSNVHRCVLCIPGERVGQCDVDYSQKYKPCKESNSFYILLPAIQTTVWYLMVFFCFFFLCCFVYSIVRLFVMLISPSLYFYLSFKFLWPAAQHFRIQVEKVNSNFSAQPECADGRAEQTFVSITTKRTTEPELSPEQWLKVGLILFGKHWTASSFPTLSVSLGAGRGQTGGPTICPSDPLARKSVLWSWPLSWPLQIKAAGKYKHGEERKHSVDDKWRIHAWMRRAHTHPHPHIYCLNESTKKLPWCNYALGCTHSSNSDPLPLIVTHWGIGVICFS